MDINIMIEGQDGLTWPRWKRLARAVEELGFHGLFRSDHFTNGSGPLKDSLETWVSLTWLASHTERIQFGSLVSPAAFRHPAMLARMAASVDDLSGGRLRLGLGAGWQEHEHHMFGLPLLPIKERFARFEEYAAIITHLLRSEEPLSLDGEYYTIDQALMLPRPQRDGGPRIIIGGNGPKYTLPLVVKYANEWNCFWQPLPKLVMLNGKLDMMLVEQDRDPQEIDRSMMTGILLAKTEAELNAKLADRGATLQELRSRGMLAGTPDMVRDQLDELADLGMDGLMIQWMDQDDMAGLVLFASAAL